jgi:predicted nucleic-acid-binding protein
MRAIDTNIIVRFLTADDPGQFAKASDVVRAGDLFVSITVLLEVEWVLRGAFKYTPSVIVKSLRGFAGLPGVTIERPELAERAFDWTEAGLDFADAIHLAGAEGCEEFVTFDKRFARLGQPLSTVTMRLL